MFRTGRVDSNTRELVILGNDDETELVRYPLGAVVKVQDLDSTAVGQFWFDGNNPVIVVQGRGARGRIRNIPYPMEGWLVEYVPK